MLKDDVIKLLLVMLAGAVLLLFKLLREQYELRKFMKEFNNIFVEILKNREEK